MLVSNLVIKEMVKVSPKLTHELGKLTNNWVKDFGKDPKKLKCSGTLL